jgi:hypothetical protein
MYQGMNQSRKNSLIQVFERVFSSTRLTMTAQAERRAGRAVRQRLCRAAIPAPPPNRPALRPINDLAGGAVHDLGRSPQETPPSTAPRLPRTITPSATSERAPMKQLSSMITGPACKRLQHAPDARAARDVHDSCRSARTSRPSPTCPPSSPRSTIRADIHESSAASTTAGRDEGGAAHDAIAAPRESPPPWRTAASAPALRTSLATLSHHDPPCRGRRPITRHVGFRRNESSTAFFSH